MCCFFAVDPRCRLVDRPPSPRTRAGAPGPWLGIGGGTATWAHAGEEATGFPEESDEGRRSRAQPASNDRPASKRVPRRWDSPPFSDGPQTRKDVKVHDPHEEGPRKLAVSLAVLGTQVVVAGTTSPVALHVSLCALHLEHGVHRRHDDEYAALEEREGEYADSAQVPHERRRRLQGTTGDSLTHARKPTRRRKNPSTCSLVQ